MEEFSATGMDYRQLPELLKSLRHQRGLSQARLAERMGEKPSLIARWEATDYRNVPHHRLADVAEALGVRLIVKVKQIKRLRTASED